MQIAIDRGSKIPLYRQLVDLLAEHIRRGVLVPGTRLPTIRDVAQQAGVTRLTVQNAYAELQSLGLVEATVGRGTFVAERAALPAAQRTFNPRLPISWQQRALLKEMLQFPPSEHVISFGPAIPDPSTYPVREFGRAMRDALADPESLSYCPPQGDLSLREALSHLLLERGIQTPPDQLLITTGAQGAINLIVQALTQPEDVLLMEMPTYPGALEAAALHHRRVVGLPLDDEGIRLVDLEQAMSSLRPRLLYLIPTFHNPTGITTSPARRSAILDLARRYEVLVVEDDVYAFLTYDDAPPLAMKAEDRDGRVIYLTSFSKAFMPGIRIGVITATEPLIAQLAGVRQAIDLAATTITQRALALYLQRGHIGAHLQTARAVYRERRDLTLSLLAQHLPPSFHWARPAGGFSLWLQLPVGLPEDYLCGELARQGILVAQGQLFYPQVNQQEGHLRLSFGSHELGPLRNGLERLTATLRAQMRRYEAVILHAPRTAAPFV